MRVVAGLLLAAFATSALAASEGAPTAYPTFQIDPSWPKELPNDMIMGDLAGISVDAQNHVWVITRQRTIDDRYLGLTTSPKTSICCRPAPAVIEFDEAGNYVQGWGGPLTPTHTAATFDWPLHEHGVTVDYKDNVWICGNGK